jgi:hypothetical protein
MSLIFYLLAVVSAFASVFAGLLVHPILAVPPAINALLLFAIGNAIDRVRDLERHAERVDAVLAALRPQPPPNETRTPPRRPAPVAPPRDPEQAARAVFDAAQAHHYQQQFAQARAAYREVVVRFPTSPHAARARQQLANLRDVRADDAVTQIG